MKTFNQFLEESEYEYHVYGKRTENAPLRPIDGAVYTSKKSAENRRREERRRKPRVYVKTKIFPVRTNIHGEGNW